MQGDVKALWMKREQNKDLMLLYTNTVNILVHESLLQSWHSSCVQALTSICYVETLSKSSFSTYVYLEQSTPIGEIHDRDNPIRSCLT